MSGGLEYNHRERGKPKASLNSVAGSWLGLFVNKFFLNSEIVILGMVSTTTTVTIYTITQYSIQLGIHLAALVVGASLSGLGGVIGTGEFQKASEIRTELFSILWLFLTVLGCSILMWNRSFVGLWVGSEYFANLLVNALMVLLVFQVVFIRADAFILNVTLDIKKKVLYGAVSTALSIGLAYWGCLCFEMAGLIIGLIIGRGVMTALFPWLVCKSLDISFLHQLPGMLRPLLTLAMLFLLSMYLGSRVEAKNWIVLILSGCTTAMLTGGVAYFAGLNIKKRTALRARLTQISFFHGLSKYPQ